uniref:ADP-ribosylation factor-like protein 2-binding protein n=1 Tax=Spermophilus dauricus TaxID=99837 RepID=A0A8C9P5J2_SPEDA
MSLCYNGRLGRGLPAAWAAGLRAVFALSFSSASHAEFDAVVGYLEDIILDDEFQLLQRNFMDKYYQEFEDTEENKLIYTPIFNEYISLVEKYIEEQLLERIPGFNMNNLRH